MLIFRSAPTFFRAEVFNGPNTHRVGSQGPLFLNLEIFCKALQTETRVLRFSPESLVKQRANHPELKPEDYLVAQALLEDARVYEDRQGPDHLVLIYNRGDKWWRMALKATEDHRFLYLKSLHPVGDGPALDRVLRRLQDLHRIR